MYIFYCLVSVILWISWSLDTPVLRGPIRGVEYATKVLAPKAWLLATVAFSKMVGKKNPPKNRHLISLCLYCWFGLGFLLGLGCSKERFKMINDNKRYKYNSKYNNHITVLLLHLNMVHTFLSSRFTPYRPLFPLMRGGSGAPSPSGAPADVGRKKNLLLSIILVVK